MSDKKKTEMNKCPVAGKCGGCIMQGIAYEKQLQKKQSQVQNLLGKFCPVKPIHGMKNPLHYRNKVHAVFTRNRDGKILSGTYQEGTHRVIPVDSCMIENQKADAIIRDIRDLLPSFKIKIYNEDSGYGLFRHVLIRVGEATGEILVVLVLSSPILPSKNNFVKALLALHPEITSIVINVNNQKTSMVLGSKNITLYGKGYIEDELCGLRFRISPSSFYQVNPVQTEYLYNKAIELAKLSGKERVLDAYCGTGTIGMIAAGSAKEVIGVELNEDAVRDARYNAKNNGVKNISFYQKDAGKFMMQLAEQKEKVDVVLMDPPRSGATPEFIHAVKTLSPSRVVYISCNPDTLARDLGLFAKEGYKAREAWPVDMFGFTGHVETCVLITRDKKGQNS